MYESREGCNADDGSERNGRILVPLRERERVVLLVM